VVEYGRRSLGDRLRFTPEGPRELQDADLRHNGEAKVIANPPNLRVQASASFPPLVQAERHQRLLEKLDARAGSLKQQRRYNRALLAAMDSLRGLRLDR
jgi:hypothetical protein